MTYERSREEDEETAGPIEPEQPDDGRELNQEPKTQTTGERERLDTKTINHRIQEARDRVEPNRRK